MHVGSAHGKGTFVVKGNRFFVSKFAVRIWLAIARTYRKAAAFIWGLNASVDFGLVEVDCTCIEFFVRLKVRILGFGLV